MSLSAACGPYVFVLFTQKNMSLCTYVFIKESEKYVLMYLCLGTPIIKACPEAFKSWPFSG